ncbi:cobalamin-binding protein [uncultured Croceitalea sp.]|uniref:cobalamin-binding protein n=1 Tax=uncultured Croceitalea sp. TaxID=1798908 RepID=UPI0033064E29
MDYDPKRIVCLTEETTETLYLLGEEARIVGISGFTVRPKRARKDKPKVSTFLDAQIDNILDLNPDLVIGFSDIQASIAKALIQRGVTVWVNNHRSVQGILEMMVQLGSLVNKRDEVLHIVLQIQNKIARIKAEAANWRIRPKVYFEEWYDPLITGIQWVGELIEIVGGIDVYSDKRASLAKDRIIADSNDVVRRNPDIILASWCGKKFKPQKILERAGWEAIEAVRTNEIYEVKSELILQPGPATLTDGLDILWDIVKKWNEKYR